MRFDDLLLFTLAAQHGSLSAAGRELGLSPAAASARLTSLEKDLGSTLMARSTRALSLTEDGAVFLTHATRAIEAIETARGALKTSKAEPRGTLKATMPGPFGRKHILPFLPEFRALYPQIELDLNMTDELVSLIDEGYDLGIRIGVAPDSTLVRTILSPNRRMVVAAPSFIEKHGMPARPEDCADYDAVVQTGLHVWHFSQGADKVEVRVSGPIRATSGDVLHDAALMGLGIVLKSAWDVAPDVASGRLVNLLPDWSCDDDGHIYAARPPSPYVPAKVRVFIDFLKSKYGPAPYWDQ